MKMKIVKGILLILGVILTALQSGNVVWASTIISAIAVGGGYFVKNVFFQSVSTDGVFDWKDIASAILLAVFATLGESVGSFVIDGSIDYTLLFKTILSVIILYFTATYFEPSKQTS